MSNQVVSMSMEKPNPMVEVDVPKKKLYTNWKAFEQAELSVKNIRCDGAGPLHMYNLGCHTNIIPKATNIGQHVDAGHGGGFAFTLGNDGKTSPLWDELRNAGLEIREVRCDHCDADVRLHPKKLQDHGFKQHFGKKSKSKPEGIFHITLSREAPLQLDDDIN